MSWQNLLRMMQGASLEAMRRDLWSSCHARPPPTPTLVTVPFCHGCPSLPLSLGEPPGPQMFPVPAVGGQEGVRVI